MGHYDNIPHQIPQDQSVDEFFPGKEEYACKIEQHYDRLAECHAQKAVLDPENIDEQIAEILQYGNAAYNEQILVSIILAEKAKAGEMVNGIQAEYHKGKITFEDYGVYEVVVAQPRIFPVLNV